MKNVVPITFTFTCWAYSALISANCVNWITNGIFKAYATYIWMWVFAVFWKKQQLHSNIIVWELSLFSVAERLTCRTLKRVTFFGVGFRFCIFFRFVVYWHTLLLHIQNVNIIYCRFSIYSSQTIRSAVRLFTEPLSRWFRVNSFLGQLVPWSSRTLFGQLVPPVKLVHNDVT